MPKISKHPKLRVHVKRGKSGQVWTSYSYDMRGTGEKDIPLGRDLAAALKKWDELHNERPRTAGTLEEAFRRWESEVLPNYESDETRKGYAKNLRKIRPVMGAATWDAVTLPDLKEYLRKRTGKTQANREVSLLSVIWNWARTEGLTDLPWPAHGMTRSKWKNAESARDVEVSDEAFEAIYKHADEILRDAMDLATATGLRVKDVLGMLMTDFRQDELRAKAGKTGKRATFPLAQSDVLPRLIEKRKTSKALHLYMLTAPNGHQVSYRMLNDRFVKARAAAAKELPECAGLVLRDMRKRAAQLAEDLDEASKLLQHSSKAVTRKHYRGGDRIRPVR
jgi:integrase